MDYETPQFYRVMDHAAGVDRDVVDMVSGSPDWGPPEALRDGLRAYADADPTEFHYAPSAGLESLRAEIAARRGVETEQVIVTNGAAQANYLAMAFALERGGHEVVCPDPVYPYYPARAAMLGADVQFVPTGPAATLDPEAVANATGPATAAICLTTPGNPTGAVADRETLEELVEVAAAADAILLSDEVYSHFDFSGQFVSARSVESAHRVVTGGVSKSLGVTGLRVGYAIVPKRYLEAIRRRHLLTVVTGSRPAQVAVDRALRQTSPAYYRHNRERLEERIETFTTALDPVARVTRPDGGFYVLARFEGYPGTMENVLELVEEAGVAGMPGATFGESIREWIRFALLTPRVETAGERLRAYFG